MAENYNILMEKELSALSGRPRLLLHSCCGPCSSWVLTVLQDYFSLSVIYINPNIFPIEEYNIRLENQKKLLKNMPSGGEIELLPAEYDHNSFLEAAAGFEEEPEGAARCGKCFRLRLEETARLASRGGFDYFATTLTVSPHKNASLINSIGQSAGERHAVKYLRSDFKKRDGYRNSIILSEKYGLHRQNYCGCEFSRNNS